jgi:hypothetical protein
MEVMKAKKGVTLCYATLGSKVELEIDEKNEKMRILVRYDLGILQLKCYGLGNTRIRKRNARERERNFGRA